MFTRLLLTASLLRPCNCCGVPCGPRVTPPAPPSTASLPCSRSMAQLSHNTNFCLQGHQQGQKQHRSWLRWLQSLRFISFYEVLSGGKRWCHHSLLFSSPWPWMGSTPRAGHAEAPKQQLVSTDCLYFVSYSVDEGLGCLRWPVWWLCWWPAPAGGHHGPKDGSTSRFGLLMPAGLQVRGARAGDRRAVMRLAG